MKNVSPLLTKITVITPSFNQGKFLEESILSVINQLYPNLEFIIIDGGSTDNSVEIIKKYEKWISYWVSEPDCGQSHAINKGLRKATGDIIFWLNSDDICLPNSFDKVIKAFLSNPEYKLVIGQAQEIDRNGNVIGVLPSEFSSWEEIVTSPRNSIRQISTFFSKCLFDELGMIDESLHIAMDNDLLVRFSKYYKPLILEDYLTAYRSHEEAKTYHQILKGYKEIDNTRPKYLKDKSLKNRYSEKSAKNWLSLSESNKFSSSERLKCLYNSLKQKPTFLFTIGFWYSFKKIIRN